MLLDLHNIEDPVLLGNLLHTIAEPSDEDLTVAIAPYRHENTPEFNALYKDVVAGYFKRVAAQ